MEEIVFFLLRRWKDLETLQYLERMKHLKSTNLEFQGSFSIGGVLRAEKVGEIEEFRGNLETLEARCRRGSTSEILAQAHSGGWWHQVEQSLSFCSQTGFILDSFQVQANLHQL